MSIPNVDEVPTCFFYTTREIKRMSSKKLRDGGMRRK